MASTSVLKPVESSMFSHAGYDDGTWQLLVTFKNNGETRAYLSVPPEVGEEFIASQSLGKAYAANIKGKYDHEILPADPATAAPAPEKKPIEGGITDEDISSVMGVPAATSQAEIKGALAARKETVPVLDAPVGDEKAEAEWYDANQAVLTAAFEDAAKNGTLGRGTVAARLKGAAISPNVDSAALAIPAGKEPEIDSIVEQGRKAATEAKGIVVRDAISYAVAGQSLKILQSVRDRAFAFLDPMREAAYKAYQFIQKRQKEALDPIDDAINHVKRGMGAWNQEQERLRLAKQAEQNRLAEEEAERQRKLQSEQMTMAEVQDALDQGDTARAEEIIANPIEAPTPYVAPVHVPSSVPQVKGVSSRSNWKVDVETLDVKQLLVAVKTGKFDVERASMLVRFDVPSLNRLAKSLREAYDVPGSRAYDDSVITSRRGK